MTLKFHYFLVCLALTLSFPLTAHAYTFDDGKSHSEDFLFNEDASRYNDIEVTNDSQLNSHITLEGDSVLDTAINVSDGGVINADIIANNTKGQGRLNITDSKQPNQFTLHNNAPISLSDPTSSNRFGVYIESSDADYQIFNNGKYSEILAGGANTSSYSNPNMK